LRLWSLDPKYLDSKALNGVWRESLLAQSVILGKTKGWKNHPQLIRFKHTQNPIETIGYYLKKIYEESCKRGYKYNKNKITKSLENIEKIKITSGQIKYEYKILKERIKKRSPKKYQEILKQEINGEFPKPHPLFTIIEGDVEQWEKSYWNLNKNK
jgi:hypothetical protein